MNKSRLTKQQKREHKQARSLRLHSRGKAWHEVSEQENSADTRKRRQWGSIA